MGKCSPLNPATLLILREDGGVAFKVFKVCFVLFDTPAGTQQGPICWSSRQADYQFRKHFYVCLETP